MNLTGEIGCGLRKYNCNKGEKKIFDTPPDSLLPTQEQYGLVSTIKVSIY